MIYILTALISIIIDQASKLYVLKNLHNPVVLIDGFLYLRLTQNTGGAFSLLSDYPLFFLILASLLAVAAVILAPKIIKLPVFYQLGVGFLVGGAVGNLIDRIRLGRVVDFIDFTFWPTFNAADIFICICLLYTSPSPRDS